MKFYRFYLPLGLTYLAAVVRDLGHEAYVYDAEIDPSCRSATVQTAAATHHMFLDALHDDTHPVWSEFRETLARINPDIVGISVLTVKHASAAKMIKMIREHNPCIKIIAGGEHVTVRPHDALNIGADFVVTGEGECGIATLTAAIGTNTSIDRIIVSPLVENVDTLPAPALDSLLTPELYRPLDYGLMMTARGCPYKCTFCGLAPIWGPRVRHHSVRRVVEEIRERKAKYGTTYFSFRNGTFTLKSSWIRAFCRKLIDDGIEIEWECLTRVDAVNHDMLRIMKAAGCRTIRVGIESGSQPMLDYMQKNITLAQIRAAAKLLHDSGIFWSAYFIVGIPPETEESLQATWQLVQEIDPPFVSIARFTPFPGTPMYDDVIKRGLLVESDTDWTWAANHSLERAFISQMDHDRFRAIADEMVAKVKDHNARHAEKWTDVRLKD